MPIIVIIRRGNGVEASCLGPRTTHPDQLAGSRRPESAGPLPLPVYPSRRFRSERAVPGSRSRGADSRDTDGGSSPGPPRQGFSRSPPSRERARIPAGDRDATDRALPKARSDQKGAPEKRSAGHHWRQRARTGPAGRPGEGSPGRIRAGSHRTPIPGSRALAVAHGSRPTSRSSTRGTRSPSLARVSSSPRAACSPPGGKVGPVRRGVVRPARMDEFRAPDALAMARAEPE
jgi:hypothetical protein